MVAMDELQIRLFTADDAPAVSRLIIRNLTEVLVSAYGETAMQALAAHYRPVDVVTRARDRYKIVSELHGEIVGTASLAGDRVSDLFVHVDHHAAGIGSELLSAVEGEAWRRGMNEVYLMAGLPARGFYENQGYVVIAPELHDVDGYPIEMLRMTKALPDTIGRDAPA
jgi:GNAT superfamily N-acetyltransferase